ncbi:methyl-CpG-binding domain-containing protein 4 [Setaria italica]|uniref:methyl-CpG-binding domain-containing protein 4 n=1 Tax=Setaria italica TaxID=4555 RepID=UPI000350BB41|nr:methyl-CpG-binding domain-containing protein 4 [Setaria italica]
MDKANDVQIEAKGEGVLEEGDEVKKIRNKRNRGSTTHPIGLYAVQCYECDQWRTVPTQEEFEKIRENFTKDKWVCTKKPNCSCKDPADIEYDSSRIWVIDRPGIPKAPPETERQVVLRSDLSRMDTYYIMPTGKRIKGASDLDKFLEANPHYKGRMSASDFNFATPKVVEETVSAWKAAMAKEQEKASGPSRGQK